MTKLAWVLLLLQAILAATVDILSKYWTINHNYRLLILGITLSLIGTPLWFIVLNDAKHLGKVGVLWTVFQLIGVLLVSVLVFKESFTTMSTIGVLLGLAAVLFLSY